MSILKRFGLLAAAATLALAVACSGGSGAAETPAEASAAAGSADVGGVQAPMFEVDPFWPKPLPNHWLLGSTIGVDADAQDHIWIVHRQSTLARNETPVLADPPFAEECCEPAPPVLEFDPEGNLVGSWGGPGDGYDWPSSNHGVTVDHMDNVWIGGNGGGDSHALKFTRDGQFLLQVGVSGREPNSLSLDSFGRIAKISVDGPENEIYFADGYGNKRVAVVDADTGEVKRFWGAYGNEPDDSYSERYTPRAARPCNSSTARSTARRCRTAGSFMCATAATTGFRCSRRTGRSSTRCSCCRTRPGLAQRGILRSRVTQTRVTSMWRTA